VWPGENPITNRYGFAVIFDGASVIFEVIMTKACFMKGEARETVFYEFTIYIFSCCEESTCCFQQAIGFVPGYSCLKKVRSSTSINERLCCGIILSLLYQRFRGLGKGLPSAPKAASDKYTKEPNGETTEKNHQANMNGIKQRDG